MSMIEQNPVFIDQKKKSRKALCAAFAAVACSAGIVGVLASDNVEKQKIAAAAATWVVLSSSPAMRRMTRRSGMAPIQAQSTPYGVHHPYQVEADRITAEMKIKGVTVYRSMHPAMSHMSIITDKKDIFVGIDFDAAVGHEGEMKAMIAHELGHFKEIRNERAVSDTIRNLSALNVWMGCGFALVAPVAPPLAFAAAAGCLALHVAGVQLHFYGSRRKEHMADLYSLSYTLNKEDLNGALKSMIPAAHQSFENYIQRQNVINKQEGKPQMGGISKPTLNYNSSWRTHPNVTERLHVVEEAAKFMPR